MFSVTGVDGCAGDVPVRSVVGLAGGVGQGDVLPVPRGELVVLLLDARNIAQVVQVGGELCRVEVKASEDMRAHG